MDTTTALAVGCCCGALVLLVLQQLFFALAVSAILREGRAETAQALGALRETLTKGLEEIEARLRRVERSCDTGGPRATDAERATPLGHEQRCRRVSTMNDDQSTPKVVHDIKRWPEPESEGGPPAQHNKSPCTSSAADAPRAAARPAAWAPQRLHRPSPSIKTQSAGDAETPRSVFDRPNMRVSSSGRLQARSSSRSSSSDNLEGAHAATAPPRAQLKTSRSPSTFSAPVAWQARGFPTEIRSGTRPVSSGALFYANVVDKMRREAMRSALNA